MSQHPAVVDGGAVLIAKPYDAEEWAEVRTAWWWHTVGMSLLSPVYPVVALTAWQAPSGQSLARRLVWAVTLTFSAMLIVGLPAFYIFSRRWYYLNRTQTDPADVGVG